MLKPIALFAVCAFSSVTWGGELLFHTVSIHTQRGYSIESSVPHINSSGENVGTDMKTSFHQYNNTNLGLGYLSNNGFLFGAYDNSYSNMTVYAGKMWMWKVGASPLEIGATATVVTGYEERTGHPISLNGALAASFRLTEKHKMYLMVIPPISNDTVGVAHLVLSKKF